MVDLDVNKENEEVEPSFDDPEDFEDDIADEELLGDVLKQEPLIDEYEENCLILFGLPIVNKEKFPKLQAVVAKVLNGINTSNKVEYPVDADGNTKGCLFVEWESKDVAQYALTVLNGYRLDKNHAFSAISIADMKSMEKPDEEWEAPKPNEYVNVGDLWSWMQNPRCRDQFAVQFEDNHHVPHVGIYWHVKGHEPEVADEGQKPNWTESVFKWTPYGSYLATIHGRAKKVNGIAVFDSETLQLVGNRYLVIENIRQFSWSPGDKNIIAYYSEASEPIPAEFGLISIPSGEKLRSGRVFNVAEAQMFWQESGARLAVHTVRYNKKTIKENGEVKYVGGVKSHLEIFELSNKKDIAIMHLPLSEPFINFGWEPNGDKFCVLIGSQAKATPFIYRIEPLKHSPVCIGQLEAGVSLNTVCFAPAGGWLAILALGSTGGNIIFVDTNGQEVKRTSIAEHPLFNKAYWDPTGRYFVSCCAVGARGSDFGFRLYTFQGRELLRKNLDRMTQFKWRPRPPVKLSEQKIKEIRKNLKTTSAKFDREDNEEKVKASQEVIDKRRKIMGAFDVIRRRNLDLIEKTKADRLQLRNGIDTEAEVHDDDLVEETITIALSTQKTLTILSEEDERD
ncbi:unnamed protein product, partial [Mesorhabditis spiculigera]